MNPASPTQEPETQSFAETAMRMGGKSEEESRRMGAVDKADEQVDRLFRHQTAASPIHKGRGSRIENWRGSGGVSIAGVAMP